MKQHTSNRTQRRAAERAALKAAGKTQPLPTAQANQALAATAGDHNHIPSDDLRHIDVGTFNQSEQASHGNAEKSTGPRTDAGKQTSSRNAIKHGLCAVNTLILPTEDRADYQALEAGWFQTYRIDPNQPPLDPVRYELVCTAARAEWFFKRAERNYSDVEAKLFTETPDMGDWTDQQYAKLTRVLRYRTANANLLARHRKELEAHIKARAAEATFYQNMQHKDAKLAFAKERLDIYREKNKPFDFDEEIEAMTQKAIRLGFHDPESEPAADPAGD